MKLLRYGQPGSEKPGLLDSDGIIRDLSGIVSDIGPESLTPESLERIRGLDTNALPVVDGSPRIGPCLVGPGKFLCIGLNYSDHAAEAGLPVPTEPILFMKANTAVCGPNDGIIIPRNSTKTDWEVELGVVIGTRAQYIAEADAMAHVAGYCLVNDVSERDFQANRGGQLVKGKSADSFGPVGPYMVTADEIADPQDLDLWLEVNGQRMQDGSTRSMIFGVAMLVAYISQFMTLEPGDLISTGTPPGVGLGQKPPVFLKPGDTVRLGIPGLGEQTQAVTAA